MTALRLPSYYSLYTVLILLCLSSTCQKPDELGMKIIGCSPPEKLIMEKMATFIKQDPPDGLLYPVDVFCELIRVLGHAFPDHDYHSICRLIPELSLSSFVNMIKNESRQEKISLPTIHSLVGRMLALSQVMPDNTYGRHYLKIKCLAWDLQSKDVCSRRYPLFKYAVIVNRSDLAELLLKIEPGLKEKIRGGELLREFASFRVKSGSCIAQKENLEKISGLLLQCGAASKYALVDSVRSNDRLLTQFFYNYGLKVQEYTFEVVRRFLQSDMAVNGLRGKRYKLYCDPWPNVLACYGRSKQVASYSTIEEIIGEMIIFGRNDCMRNVLGYIGEKRVISVISPRISSIPNSNTQTTRDIIAMVTRKMMEELENISQTVMVFREQRLGDLRIVFSNLLALFLWGLNEPSCDNALGWVSGPDFKSTLGLYKKECNYSDLPIVWE